MRIRTLVDNINYIELVNDEDLSGEITGISYNSKKTQPNDLFICLTGEHVDGHEYAEEAVKCGAFIKKNFENEIRALLTEIFGKSLGLVALEEDKLVG